MDEHGGAPRAQQFFPFNENISSPSAHLVSVSPWSHTLMPDPGGLKDNLPGIPASTLGYPPVKLGSTPTAAGTQPPSYLYPASTELLAQL